MAAVGGRVTLSADAQLEILDVVSRADAAATRRDADAYTSLSGYFECLLVA